MPFTDISVTFNDVLRSPLTYALIVVSIVATIFVNSFIGAKNQSTDDCQKEKTELRIQLAASNTALSKERADKDALITSLLVKEGIINNLKVVTDSLNKNK